MKIYGIYFYHYKEHILTVFAKDYTPMDLYSKEDVSAKDQYSLHVSDTVSMDNQYEMFFDKNKFTHIKIKEV